MKANNETYLPTHRVYASYSIILGYNVHTSSIIHICAITLLRNIDQRFGVLLQSIHIDQFAYSSSPIYTYITNIWKLKQILP